jgi:hypothetical protein
MPASKAKEIWRYQFENGGNGCSVIIEWRSNQPKARENTKYQSAWRNVAQLIAK